MRRLETKDIQDISLEILRDVHAFCVENRIKYSLAEGTLIGAIRHKGFIPWDDDLDIMMPRPDYDRFCETYKAKNPNLELFCESLGNSNMAYARVCDMEKSHAKILVPWANKSTGVWIDIFPADSVPNTWEKAELHINRVKHFFFWNQQKRFLNVRLCERKGFKQKLKLIVKWICASCYPGSPLKEQIALMKSIDFNKAEYWGQLAFFGNKYRKMHPMSIWKETILVPFENEKFYVMQGYDIYLRDQYKKYMELPPIEKRVTHPSEFYFVE